jgi:hypothetical protein
MQNAYLKVSISANQCLFYLNYPASKLKLFCATLLHKVWSVWLCRIFRNNRVTCMTARKKCIWNVTCFDFLYNLYLKLFSFQDEFRETLSQTVFMDNVVGKENRYGLECSAFKPWRRRNFPHMSGTAPPPARWTTGLLHGVEWPRHSADHPPPSSAQFNERTKLYLPPPTLVPSWSVRVNFIFT